MRVRCTLASVPQQVSLAFEQRYRPNTNPEIHAVARRREESFEPLADALPNGSLTTLRNVDHFATPESFGFIDATLEFLDAVPA